MIIISCNFKTAVNMRSTLRLLVCALAVSFHLSIAEEQAAAGGGTIYGRLQFPDQSPFNATHTQVVLNHGQRITYPQLDGQFAFTDVPPGVHVIDVHNPTYHFSQFKVQILADDTAHPKVLEYYYPGAPKQPQALPLVWTPLATYDYFEPRPRFSMFGMLRNPMVLMMLVMGGMMFFMPKMMDQLEPEEKERMKKQMAMQQDPTQMFGQLWGELTGGGNAAEAITGGAGSAKPSPNNKKKPALQK